MTEKERLKVGVVLINDLGLYSSTFLPMKIIQGTREDVSFLIANSQYFNNNGTTSIAPPPPFENNWRPPEYGKPLYYIKEKRVPEKLAKAYMETYSLDGKFAEITDLGYLCVPDIEKVCKYLTSTNPIMQRQALQIMHRDKTVIDLIYAALEVSRDLTDTPLRENLVKKIFWTITNGFKKVPLTYRFNLPPELTDRSLRLKKSNRDEPHYAEIMDKAITEVCDEAKSARNAEQYK